MSQLLSTMVCPTSFAKQINGQISWVPVLEMFLGRVPWMLTTHTSLCTLLSTKEAWEAPRACSIYHGLSYQLHSNEQISWVSVLEMFLVRVP